MKIVIINKSDSTGGAAVVSRRLMEALRAEGCDARMLVVEKLSDSPFVKVAASKFSILWKFLLERLKIFLANGFNRKTLFKIDTGSEGLPLWRHPWVKSSDAVLLNWVNQGMLSLKGVEKIIKSGKPVVWTMHDMWCMTGICHHAGLCDHFKDKCGFCPLLENKGSIHDLSFKVHRKKKKIYDSSPKSFAFVSVSRWLKDKAISSSLLKEGRIEIIPNTFPIKEKPEFPEWDENSKIRILFGAARIDDPVKGLDTLREVSVIISEKYPRISEKLELAFYGRVKNREAMSGFRLPVVLLGTLQGEEEVEGAYRNAQILVSASSYETFAVTLVEAQAYGCIPVSFSQGGQVDIIDHLKTGYLADYSEDLRQRAENLAKGIIWAVEIIEDKEKSLEIKRKMYESVRDRFSYSSVAKKYVSLIESLK